MSFWRDLEAISAWRNHPEHRAVWRAGRQSWYAGFHIRVARVDRQVIWPPAGD